MEDILLEDMKASILIRPPGISSARSLAASERDEARPFLVLGPDGYK